MHKIENKNSCSFIYKWFASIYLNSRQQFTNVDWRDGNTAIDTMHIGVSMAAHLLFIRMGTAVAVLLYHFLSAFLKFTLSMWTHCSQRNNLHTYRAIDDLILILFLLSIKMLNCITPYDGPDTAM